MRQYGEFEAMWRRSGGKQDVVKTIQRGMNKRNCGLPIVDGWEELYNKPLDKETFRQLWQEYVR